MGRRQNSREELNKAEKLGKQRLKTEQNRT